MSLVQTLKTNHVATNRITISPGSASGSISGMLTGSATVDLGSIADGDMEAADVTVTGAELGDFAMAAPGIDVTDLVVSATVTAADTVTVVFANNTGSPIDLASQTVRALVFKIDGP